ncbi:MAG: CopD family protein [Salibacteraceae bacterium]
MEILYIKSLHIIFVVSWFAGLFYMPRLFIYHRESRDEDGDVFRVLDPKFRLMQRRLWYIITWPAAVIATAMGLWLVHRLGYWNQTWMQVKLALTALLWTYHLLTHRIFLKHQSSEMPLTGFQLRLWNEVATLFLVAIVFIVVLKSTIDWIWGTMAFVGVGVALMVAVRLYARYRKSR